MCAFTGLSHNYKTSGTACAWWFLGHWSRLTVTIHKESWRLVYEEDIPKENSLYNRDEYVKTANRMKVHDICVPLIHNVMQSETTGACGDCTDCLLYSLHVLPTNCISLFRKILVIKIIVTWNIIWFFFVSSMVVIAYEVGFQFLRINFINLYRTRVNAYNFRYITPSSNT